MTWTDYLCGRASGTWSSTPLSARWYGWQQPGKQLIQCTDYSVQVLDIVTSAKYLGVDISGGLSWNSHIDRITGNANRTLGYIKINIKTKNTKVRETAYNTLVRPQLEYAAPIWDPYTKVKIHQLEKIQRRTARWTTNNYDYRSSVTAMLDQLGWRTLEQRQADERLCLFYKIIHTSPRLHTTHTQSVPLLPLNDFSPDPNN